MMILAPWRSPLMDALERNSHLAYTRYLQLATVQDNGHPANRTVVFRGFLENTNQLQFITDIRSEKAAQIEHQPWGEACWYFPETREQFRLTGQLTLVKAEQENQILQQARQGMWQTLSDAARVQFAWPQPGEPRMDADAFAPLPPNPTQPPDNFCLLLLEPLQIDHLELRGNPQNRWLYRCNQDLGWSKQAINP
jgi:pyridoxamine 5'-phosphate oxidase